MPASSETNGAPGVAEPPPLTESEYRLLLLSHWRSRVCGGNLREHDLALSRAAQERHRKRRRAETGAPHALAAGAPAPSARRVRDKERGRPGGRSRA